MGDQSPFIKIFQFGASAGPAVAIKDCIDIKGMVTRCGSEALVDAPAAKTNADVVDRLLEAGCQIVGKTRMHELAFGMTGINAFEGTPLNPTWPDRIPGGSSSGSAAAVAARLVDFSIGTDTGGSIRQPAICCGVIGLKPTFDRVSRKGAIPFESTLDCIGPFASSISMIEHAMSAIYPGFEALPAATNIRIARLKLDASIDPDVAEAFLKVEAHDGDVLHDVDIASMGDAYQAGITIISRETLQANEALLERDAPLGKDVRGRLERGRLVTDDDMRNAEAVRQSFTQDIDRLLESFDVILTPALPIIPPLLSQADDAANVLQLTLFLRPFNLSGHPAIVLPMLTSKGLPAGVQLVARKNEDERLCAIARRIAQTNPIFQIKE